MLPSLVKQYHEESFFDVKLNPSDLQYLIDPKESTFDIQLTEAGIIGKFPLSFDIVIGDKVVRKLITSVKFSLKVSTSSHVPEEVDIKASLSLSKLESFDQYQRPLPKESSDKEIPIITNLSQSYKLPINRACYGFSSFDIDYNPKGYISLSFLPQPEIP